MLADVSVNVVGGLLGVSGCVRCDNYITICARETECGVLTGLNWLRRMRLLVFVRRVKTLGFHKLKKLLDQF
jgi:hypothetical protein